MIRSDDEDTAEQLGAFRRTIGDEGDDGGQMQRRQMIRIRSQDLAAQHLGPIRAARAVMFGRLFQQIIDRRLTHDATPPFPDEC